MRPMTLQLVRVLAGADVEHLEIRVFHLKLR
jgi:hypothetical protein